MSLKAPAGEPTSKGELIFSSAAISSKGLKTPAFRCVVSHVIQLRHVFHRNFGRTVSGNDLREIDSSYFLYIGPPPIEYSLQGTSLFQLKERLTLTPFAGLGEKGVGAPTPFSPRPGGAVQNNPASSVRRLASILIQRARFNSGAPGEENMVTHRCEKFWSRLAEWLAGACVRRTRVAPDDIFT